MATSARGGAREPHTRSCPGACVASCRTWGTLRGVHMGDPRVQPMLSGETVRHTGEGRGRSGNGGEATSGPRGRRPPHPAHQD